VQTLGGHTLPPRDRNTDADLDNDDSSCSTPPSQRRFGKAYGGYVSSGLHHCPKEARADEETGPRMARRCELQ
jgi:hypothetical protein